MTSPHPNFLLRPPTSPTSFTKQNYLSAMLSAFQKFEYTRSPQVLKAYIKKTRQQLAAQIDRLNKCQYPQEDLIEQSEEFTPEYRKERQLNQMLERQYVQELDIANGNNLRESQIRFNGKCQEMSATLFTLDKELDRLVQQNRAMSAKLEKQRFFREWQVMYKEYEGAKSLNSRLKAELQRKKIEIQGLSKK